MTSSAQKKARADRLSCEFAFVVAEKLRGGWVARGDEKLRITKMAGAGARG